MPKGKIDPGTWNREDRDRPVPSKEGLCRSLLLLRAKTKKGEGTRSKQLRIRIHRKKKESLQLEKSYLLFSVDQGGWKETSSVSVSEVARRR